MTCIVNIHVSCVANPGFMTILCERFFFPFFFVLLFFYDGLYRLKQLRWQSTRIFLMKKEVFFHYFIIKERFVIIYRPILVRGF